MNVIWAGLGFTFAGASGWSIDAGRTWTSAILIAVAIALIVKSRMRDIRAAIRAK